MPKERTKQRKREIHNERKKEPTKERKTERTCIHKDMNEARETAIKQERQMDGQAHGTERRKKETERHQ